MRIALLLFLLLGRPKPQRFLHVCPDHMIREEGNAPHVPRENFPCDNPPDKRVSGERRRRFSRWGSRDFRTPPSPLSERHMNENKMGPMTALRMTQFCSACIEPALHSVRRQILCLCFAYSSSSSFFYF